MIDTRTLTKDQLAKLALEKYEVTLNMRNDVVALRAQVDALENPVEDTVVDDTIANPLPEYHYICNKDNGRILIATDFLKDHLKNYFDCDKDGKHI